MSITLADQSWRSRALCDGGDTELWFPVGDKPADPYAQATCDVCPVRTECLEWALANPKLAACGVWGGLTEGERYSERRRRQRRGAAA